MKNLFFISIACSIFSGTSLSATAQKHINTANFNDGSPAGKSLKFIEGIEIKAANVSNVQVIVPVPGSKEQLSKDDQFVALSPEIENISSLQFKYGQLLNRNVENIKNISLYRFIDEWLDSRYRYGGSSKRGIDCSALTCMLMNTVFAIKLPRTAREQYNMASKLNSDKMTEGDLVFFHIKRGISHVGVYLGDGYFVHASRNNGVTISNLDDPYYRRHFSAAGRVIGNENTIVSK